MRELSEGRFSLNFENTSKGSYFVIGMAGDEKIQELQVEQLNSNSFPGILKFNLHYKNDLTYLYYNITSKIGLEQFLNKRKLKKEEFINIIQAIAKTLIKSQNFLVYDKNMIIDKKFIYINSSTQEIFLTYLPVDIETDILKDYRDFVMDLIMRAADIDESGSDNYLQRILTKLKSEDFSIESFNKLLCEIKLLKATNMEQKEILQNVRNLEIIPQKNSNKKITENKKRSFQYRKSSFAIAIGLQLLICSLTICGIVTGLFNKIGDPSSTYAGLVIVIIGGEYLFFRKLSDKKNADKNVKHETRNDEPIKHQNFKHQNIKQKVNQINGEIDIQNK